MIVFLLILNQYFYFLPQNTEGGFGTFAYNALKMDTDTHIRPVFYFLPLKLKKKHVDW